MPSNFFDLMGFSRICGDVGRFNAFLMMKMMVTFRTKEYCFNMFILKFSTKFSKLFGGLENLIVLKNQSHCFWEKGR